MSVINEYLKTAHDAHTVESSVRILTTAELITEIIDKLNIYEKKIFVGKYTYIIFEDCKYILSNNFFQTKILPSWQK